MRATTAASAVRRFDLHWGDDLSVADMVRSELGPLVKRLDQPHVHVMASNGVVTLHGDVGDLRTARAVEHAVARMRHVRDVQSHLHIGLLPSDTRPSSGHLTRRSALRKDLETAARKCGFWIPTESSYALHGLLGPFLARLPAAERRRLLSHLPADVRALCQPPHWLDTDVTTVRRAHDFATIVAVAAGTSRDRADTLARRVLPVLRQLLADDSVAVAHALPQQLRRMWLAPINAPHASRSDGLS